MLSISPINVIASLGSPARLDCRLDNPSTYIRWALGDGLTMINYDQCNCIVLTMVSNSSLVRSLYFNETTQGTAGNYTCLTIGRNFDSVVGSIAIAGEHFV